MTIYKVHVGDAIEGFYQNRHWAREAKKAGYEVTPIQPQAWEFAHKGDEWKWFTDMFEALDFMGIAYEDYRAGHRKGKNGWQFMGAGSPELSYEVVPK